MKKTERYRQKRRPTILARNLSESLGISPAVQSLVSKQCFVNTQKSSRTLLIVRFVAISWQSCGNRTHTLLISPRTWRSCDATSFFFIWISFDFICSFRARQPIGKWQRKKSFYFRTKSLRIVSLVWSVLDQHCWSQTRKSISLGRFAGQFGRFVKQNNFPKVWREATKWQRAAFRAMFAVLHILHTYLAYQRAAASNHLTQAVTQLVIQLVIQPFESPFQPLIGLRNGPSI